jgi:hypothetical protein
VGRSRERASRLHVMNPPMLVELLSDVRPRVVVMSSTDRFATWKAGGQSQLSALDAALERHYIETARFEDISRAKSIGVYVRR